MTVPMIKSIGDVPYPIDTHSDAFSPLLTAGAALGITGEATDSAAWLQRVSTSDGPTTVRSIHGNTVVESGALVPVNMTGIETTGFNQWDEQVVKGYFDGSGGWHGGDSNLSSKNPIPVFPGASYYISAPTGSVVHVTFWKSAVPSGASAAGEFVPFGDWSNNYANTTVTVPEDARYMHFNLGTSYGTTYNHDICVNISDPTRNGTYEPYWQQTRSIPAGTLRSAGSVYDEQTATERIVRVGVVDLGTLDWESLSTASDHVWRASLSGVTPAPKLPSATVVANAEIAGYTCMAYSPITKNDNRCFAIGDNGRVIIVDSAYSTAQEFAAAMSGRPMFYEVAEPTVTTYDPPLNLTYRTAAGGVERVVVPTGEQSAPPTIVTAQGYTAESLRDAALATIAPVENGLASTNYAVGSYLVHGGQLCKVTTAIATGESISIGTNVTATTVMAEILSLVQ